MLNRTLYSIIRVQQHTIMAKNNVNTGEKKANQDVQPVDVIQDIQLLEPKLMMYYEDLEDRVIWIETDDDGEKMIEATKRILKYNKNDKGIPVEDRIPIKLMIYSYGGDLNATLSLIDTCRISKTPIWTVVMGVAMSAGFFIAISGHKRFCIPKSQYLIHSGSGCVSGVFEQTESFMDNYKQSVNVVRKHTLERTNISPSMFENNKAKEWFVYSEQAKELGICDVIIEDLDDIL